MYPLGPHVGNLLIIQLCGRGKRKTRPGRARSPAMGALVAGTRDVSDGRSVRGLRASSGSTDCCRCTSACADVRRWFRRRSDERYSCPSWTWVHEACHSAWLILPMAGLPGGIIAGETITQYFGLSLFSRFVHMSCWGEKWHEEPFFATIPLLRKQHPRA